MEPRVPGVNSVPGRGKEQNRGPQAERAPMIKAQQWSHACLE